jgi:hypothetical protein
MTEHLWVSEGCGLEWFISAEEAQTFAERMKGTGTKLREFRTQHANGRNAQWCITPLLGTEPRGRVQVRCVPYPTAVDNAFRVSNSGDCFAIFGSEAEARLAVALYEFCRADVPPPEKLVVAAGFKPDDKGDPGVRSFVRKLDGGALNLLLHRSTKRPGIGSLTLQFLPIDGARPIILAKIDAQPEHGAPQFGLDIMAALSVAGARQALGHMAEPLTDGEEFSFIADFIAPQRSTQARSAIF